MSIFLLTGMGVLFALNAQAKSSSTTSSRWVTSSRTRLSEKNLVLQNGDTTWLRLENAKSKVLWKSLKKSVATVTYQGIVKAKKKGTCIIEATSAGKTYQCKVVVCNNKKDYKYNSLPLLWKPSQNKGKIVIAGSSAIGHWENASEVFAPYEVLNMGIGGSTVKQWLKWYKKLIVAYQPSAVVLFPGTRNEIAKRHSVRKTTSHVCELLKRLDRELPGVPIYYMSVYCNYKQQKNWPLEQECNQKVKEYCKGLKNVYYVDVTEVLTDGNAPRPGVISDDGIHMSENGYALWNTVIVPIVKQMLGNENK